MPIRLTDLRPYLQSLDRRQKAHPDAVAWKLLRERWEALIAACQETLKVAAAGTPLVRWERDAAGELVRLAENVSPEAAWRTAVAMSLLQEHEPRRFATDNSFFVQLGRRVRHLTEISRGSFYDPATGRVKHVYRDINQRVAILIGQYLARTFGVVGRYFAEQEQREADRKQAETNAMWAALREVGMEGPTT